MNRRHKQRKNTKRNLRFPRNWRKGASCILLTVACFVALISAVKSANATPAIAFVEKNTSAESTSAEDTQEQYQSYCMYSTLSLDEEPQNDRTQDISIDQISEPEEQDSDSETEAEGETQNQETIMLASLRANSKILLPMLLDIDEEDSSSSINQQDDASEEEPTVSALSLEEPSELDLDDESATAMETSDNQSNNANDESSNSATSEKDVTEDLTTEESDTTETSSNEDSTATETSDGKSSSTTKKSENENSDATETSKGKSSSTSEKPKSENSSSTEAKASEKSDNTEKSTVDDSDTIGKTTAETSDTDGETTENATSDNLDEEEMQALIEAEILIGKAIEARYGNPDSEEDSSTSEETSESDNNETTGAWIEKWQPLTEELITALSNLIMGEVGGYISTQPYDKAIYIYELTGSVPLHRLEVGYTKNATCLYDVVHESGQFGTAWQFDLTERIGVDECYEVAERLLREGPIGPRNLVFQSTGKQGTPYWDTGADAHYATTYFGTSSKFADYES